MIELINKIDEGLTQEEWDILMAELDFNLGYTNKPCGCRALALKSGDNYKVYVNAGLTNIEQKKALKHELMHLYHNDFSPGKSLKEKELRINRK